MRPTGTTAVLLCAVLLAAGCGWSPPSAPPPKPDTCAPTDGPGADIVAREIRAVAPPAPGATWTQVDSGHTANCRLYWVQIKSSGTELDVPQQVLFFDRQTPLGPATPEPRPYVSVVTSGDETVSVQYQWRQGSDAPCCPTGIGSVRFRVGDDGKLVAVDPIPNG
jgi:hypothetical protein